MQASRGQKQHKLQLKGSHRSPSLEPRVLPWHHGDRAGALPGTGLLPRDERCRELFLVVLLQAPGAQVQETPKSWQESGTDTRTL